ncbi:MAG: hypothetical protein R6V83_03685 [Candidatus Thorarchaeota archaeon]
MSVIHTFLEAAIISFITISTKLWWDLRQSGLEFDKQFRDNLTEYKEEYWSRFVVTPLSKFFEKASELIESQPQDYGGLKDVLDHRSYGSTLEEHILEASEQHEVYRRLSNLTTSFKKAQDSQRTWIGRTILILIILLGTIGVDFINQYLVDSGFSISSALIRVPCLVIFIVSCIGSLFTSTRFILAYNKHQDLQSFYSNCQDKIHGVK